MNDKAAIVDYLTERLNGDASECTHMQVPTSWLRVLIDLPAPPEPSQAEESPSDEPGEPEPEPTPPPAPNRRRKTNQTDSEVS